MSLPLRTSCPYCSGSFKLFIGLCCLHVYIGHIHKGIMPQGSTIISSHHIWWLLMEFQLPNATIQFLQPLQLRQHHKTGNMISESLKNIYEFFGMCPREKEI
ncbi:hypothetical protein EVAR_56664_1 [Eumeta japonica]|uniref:Uncharacterized protein n=1 Tax=Eumeta variegata TaxID=151549 RepID=A0A4C1YU12_EUMVA|nr:hypothetical protein EVAR_56664_1 [Eumeta japonica]